MSSAPVPPVPILIVSMAVPEPRLIVFAILEIPKLIVWEVPPPVGVSKVKTSWLSVVVIKK